MTDRPELPPDDAFILQQTKAHSRTYALRLWDLLSRHTPEGGQTPENRPASIPRTSVPAAALFLKSTPWLLGAGFLLSFFWDFEGVSASLWGFSWALDGIIRMLSVSGLIGYLTNWIAITMLFRPVERRPLLRQGLIPAQKFRIAEKLADSVSSELINAEVIRKKLQDQRLISVYRERLVTYTRQVVRDPAFQSELKQLLVNYVEDLLGDQAVRQIIARKTFEFIERSVEDKALEKLAFKTYKLLRGEEATRIIERSIAELPGRISTSLDRIDDVLENIPSAVEEHADILENWAVSAIVNLVNSLDIRTIVVDNLYQYDEQRFEKLIKGSTNEQLQYIQYLGAVLGTVGGLVIWQPVPALIGLSALGLMVWGADEVIYRVRNRS